MFRPKSAAMPLPPTVPFEDPTVRRVFILKADRLHVAAIAREVGLLWPDAQVETAGRVSAAVAALTERGCDLLITGLGMLDCDACGLIRTCAVEPRRARLTLVVTGRQNPWVYSLLHELPIHGAFDTLNENPCRLATALQATAAGRRYFSETYLAFPWHRPEPSVDVFRLLTPTEILILAVLGDGCDPQLAALRLDLKLTTINAACRSMHRKLRVQTKGDLMRIAIEAGLVRSDRGRTEWVGFEMLVEHYERVQKKHRHRSPFVAALCARGKIAATIRKKASGMEG